MGELSAGSVMRPRAFCAACVALGGRTMVRALLTPHCGGSSAGDARLVPARVAALWRAARWPALCAPAQALQTRA